MLCSSEADAVQLLEQPFTPVLIGGYDGSQNFGDLLQCLSTVTLYQTLSRTTRVAVVAEIAHHAAVEHVRANLLPADSLVLYFGDDVDQSGSGDLVPLRGIRRSGLHFYGGGYINDNWGARKRRMAEAVASECRVSLTDLPIIMTGLQVSVGVESKKWKDLFCSARFVGVRDRLSESVIASAVDRDLLAQPVFTGDDALPALAGHRSHRSRQRCNHIAAHLNQADYSTSDANGRLERVIGLIAQAVKEGARACDIIVGYADGHVNEFRSADLLIERLRAEGVAAVYRVRNLFDEVVRTVPLQMNYDLVVTCSYHVALTAVLAGCPTCMLVENDYYAQKLAGLVDQLPTTSTLNLPSFASLAGTLTLKTDAEHRREVYARVKFQNDAISRAVSLLLAPAQAMARQ